MEENKQNTAAPAQPAQAAAMPPYAAGTGSVPVAADKAAFDRMTYRERLALKKSDPETYRALRE